MRDFCGQSICYLFGKLYEFSRQLTTKWREVAKNGSNSLEVMFSVALFRSKQYSRFFSHHLLTEGQIWCRIKTRFQYFNFGMCGFWEKLPRRQKKKNEFSYPVRHLLMLKSVPAHHIFGKTCSSLISFCSFSAIYVYKLIEKSNNTDGHKKPNTGNTEGERYFYHLKFLNLRCLEISRHVLFGPPSAATNTARLALIYKQIGASISRQNWS